MSHINNLLFCTLFIYTLCINNLIIYCHFRAWKQFLWFHIVYSDIFLYFGISTRFFWKFIELFLFANIFILGIYNYDSGTIFILYLKNSLMSYTLLTNYFYPVCLFIYQFSPFHFYFSFSLFLSVCICKIFDKTFGR